MARSISSINCLRKKVNLLSLHPWRLVSLGLCLFCLAPVNPPAEPVKGATKLMQDAKASREVAALMPLTLAVPPDTNKHPLYVSWDRSSDSHVMGYNVYYGTASGVYTNKNNAGNINSNTINVVTDGVVNYITATAYDAIGLESPYSAEVRYPPASAPPRTNYVMVSLDYYSAGMGQWVTNYSSKTYTNPPGNQFFRYRNGDKPGSPNANNRAWQSRTEVSPWLDIPDTLVQGTNAGPIRFQITNWHSP